MTHSVVPHPVADAVMAELDAAERLLLDPRLEPSLGVLHVRRAWTLLFERDPEVGTASLHEYALRRLPGASPAEFEYLDDGGDAVRIPVVLEHVGALRRALVPPKHTFAIGPALGFLAALTVAMLAAILISVSIGPRGPWRAAYYDNTKFEGKAVVQHVRKVEFDWGRSSPAHGIGQDRWSGIYRTCLTLEDPAVVRFKLSSDDGSRLLIDDEQVVENWGFHGRRTRTGKKRLEPGVYELKVEHFDERLGANLELLAAFGDDAEYATVPLDRIRRPKPGKQDACE